MDALYQFGIRLIQSIQTLSPGLDGIMKTGSFLGSIEFYLVIIPFIYWVVDRRIGVRTLLVLIYVDLLGVSLKLLFHEPRPYWIGGVKQLGTETTYGVPSSHSGRSLVVSGYLATKIKRSWFWVTTIIFVLFVGISRLYLGVHFPHDVLAGWLLGLIVIWAVSKWESFIHDWLDDKSLSTQIILGLVDSILMVLIGFIIRFIISGTVDPVEWSQYSANARTITHFFTLAGAAFGTYTGYALMRKYARFNAKGDWTKRGIRYLVGIVGLLVLYFGLSKLFDLFAVDESTLGYILRYIRYSLVTFWATFLAPWVFLKTKLAEPE